jgi:hypothetical protein
MSEHDDLPDSMPLGSRVTLRPSVMLVRVERGEEQPELSLEHLGIRKIRVRHPLQACVRMQVLRPEVILVGSNVQPWDLAKVLNQAHAILAAVMPRSQLHAGDRLRAWVLDTIAVVRARRAEALEALEKTAT